MRNTLMANVIWGAAVLAITALAVPAHGQGMTQPGSRAAGYSSATPGNSVAPMGGATGGSFGSTNFGGASAGAPGVGAAANPGVPSGAFDSNHSISYSSGAGAANATGGMATPAQPSEKGLENYRHPKLNQMKEATAAPPPASHAATPAPAPTADTAPQALLHQASADLAAHRPAQAQDALERAETRLLDRSTAAGHADTQPMIERIAAARRAIGNHDLTGARQIVDSLLKEPAAAKGM